MDDTVEVWYSELNNWMTEYECKTLEELDNLMWYEYGVLLIVL